MMYFVMNIYAENIYEENRHYMYIKTIVFNEILLLLNAMYEFLYLRQFCIYVYCLSEIDFYFFHVTFLRRYKNR